MFRLEDVFKNPFFFEVPEDEREWIRTNIINRQDEELDDLMQLPDADESSNLTGMTPIGVMPAQLPAGPEPEQEGVSIRQLRGLDTGGRPQIVLPPKTIEDPNQADWMY